LALTLIGCGRAFDPDVLTGEISIVAKSRAGSATAIKAMADIHNQWLAIGGDTQRAT
jgi:hypothetical protein